VARSRSPKPATLSAPRWTSIAAAAAVLGLTPEALRKQLERRAVRAPDGGIEADLDGVRARKLGRTWRVTLGIRWTEPLDASYVDPRRSKHADRSRNQDLK
jgi:hypothetical protein